MPETPPNGSVADAPAQNWVDRYAPAAARPYLRLSRADRPVGTWLLLIPCWWGLGLAIMADPLGGSIVDLRIALLCIAGALLMRGAGCTWNDLSDQDIDAAVARTRSRPLPSGQVSQRGAYLWLALQLLLAAAILSSFNRATIYLGVAALIPVVIYPFAKRFTWWPQLFLGLAFNWGALLGWSAHGSKLTLAPVLLYGAGIAWTLFYDTIYAHQDREDDALIGVRSTARLFGPRTGIWLGGFLMCTVILLTGAVIAALLGPGLGENPLVLALALAAPWALGWHLAWQMRQLDIDQPAVCLRIFRSNRDAGLLVALIFLATIGAGMLA